MLISSYPHIAWPKTWTDLVAMVERCSHEMRIIPLKWHPPESAIMKLNTDRSALSNPCRIGGGGILRNYQGDMIFAFLIPMGFGSNNNVELQATIYGIRWCLQFGYKYVML